MCMCKTGVKRLIQIHAKGPGVAAKAELLMVLCAAMRALHVHCARIAPAAW
jgi:hypothetical protein